jgi:hypothetical protein
VLPQRLVPLHVPVAPEDVVDQDIEAAALVLDGCHQGGDLAGILVINHSCGARPARRPDQVTGLLDRLRPADLGRPRRPAAAPCRIDEEPSAGQLDGNRAARAPGSASHQGDQHPLVPTSHQASKYPIDRRRRSLSDELIHTLVVSLVPAQGVSFPGNVGTGR